MEKRKIVTAVTICGARYVLPVPMPLEEIEQCTIVAVQPPAVEVMYGLVWEEA